MTFTKYIVGFLLLNGVFWIYASYYLAYIGRTQIAETLSKTVAAEVVGVIAVYAVKALLENLSKNNNWPDKICRPVEADPAPGIVPAVSEPEMKEGDGAKV